MISLSNLTLFPTQQSLTWHVERLVLAEGDQAAIIPHLMTIGAFEKKLAAEILGSAKEISELGRTFIASKVADRYYRKKNRGAFTAAINFNGFIPTLLSFFNELGAGLVTPNDLEQIKGYAPGKEEEILHLFTAYHQEIKNLGYIDSAVKRMSLVTAIGEPGIIEKSPTLKNSSSIQLVDIYQFTPYRFELFKRIAKMIPVTIITPTPDKRSRAFGFIVTNLEKFESLGDKAGLLEIDFEEPGESDLSFLRDNIFELANTAGASKPDMEEKVVILKCPSRYREIEEIGVLILDYRNERGSKWSDFGIVLRDVNKYGAIIEDVFNRYKIPFHLNRGIKLCQNPLIQSVLALFEAIESGFVRDEVLRIIGSPYFTRYSKLNIDEAQNIFLSSKIIDGTSSLWRRRLNKHLHAIKGTRLREANLIVKETIRIIEALEVFAKQNRPPNFFERLDKILNLLGLNPEPAKVRSRGDTTRGDTILFRDNNAYAQLMETLREHRLAVVDLKMGATPLGFNKIKNIFLNALTRLTVSEPYAEDRNRVSVLNAHDAIGLSFPFLSICGLHEKEFPKYLETPSLLHEVEKYNFNEAHAKIIPLKDASLKKGRRVFEKARNKWQEEALLFYQAIKAAKEKLCLSFSVLELNGGILTQSQFIDDVLETLKPGKPTVEKEEAHIKSISSLAIHHEPENLPDPEERKMWALKELFRPEQKNRSQPIVKTINRAITGTAQWNSFKKLVALARIEVLRENFFLEPDVERKLREMSAFSGLVTDGAGLINKALVIKNMGRYSPTRLEQYGQCPFRFFASSLLHLKTLDEPSYEIDARGAGSLAHAALELFYGKLIKSGSLPLTGSKKELLILEKAAYEAFKEHENKGRQGHPAIWRVEKERTLILLKLFLKLEIEEQKEYGFIPVAVEAPFDFKEFYRDGAKLNSPLEIDMPCGGLRYIVGRVDRIDVKKEANALRVVDYKLSASATKYKQMIHPDNMGATSFQPPVYMMLADKYVKKHLSSQIIKSVAGGYILIRAKTLTAAYIITDRLKKDDLQNRIEEKVNGFNKELSKTIEQIEKGLFPVNPQTCEFCDYAGLCRYISASPFTVSTAQS